MFNHPNTETVGFLIVCKTVRPMLSYRCPGYLSCLSVTLVYCGQTIGRIKVKLCTHVGLGTGHTVLDGDPAAPKGAQPPQFSAHVCCDQTAGCIEMQLGTEVCLSQGHFVLVGDPALHPHSKKQRKGHSPNIFAPCLLWPNGWMHQDTTWYGDRSWPRRHCVRWYVAPPAPKVDLPPVFGPAHIYCGQTVAHLSYC